MPRIISQQILNFWKGAVAVAQILAVMDFVLREVVYVKGQQYCVFGVR